LVVAALVALDAVLPIAPSETLVVAGGVLAADGALSLPLLSAAAATGALTGHTVLYLLGRWAPIDPNAAVR
jgi:membrane protein DedA with SNARE-associated domain